MPEFQSIFTRMAAKADDVAFDVLCQEVATGLGLYFEQQLVERGIFTSHEEADRFEEAAARTPIHLTQSEMDGLVADERTELLRKNSTCLVAIREATDLQAFDTAMVAYEQFLVSLDFRLTHELFFEVARRITTEANRSRQIVDELKRELVAERGLRPGTEDYAHFEALTQEIFGSTGSGEGQQDRGEVVQFSPPKGRK